MSLLETYKYKYIREKVSKCPSVEFTEISLEYFAVILIIVALSYLRALYRAFYYVGFSNTSICYVKLSL
ncbi:MAG: hypothetical protein QW208_06485 [Acidilobaceae archaeon]